MASLTNQSSAPDNCGQQRMLSPSNSTTTTGRSVAAVEQQQQELLKLIAQHFHSQLTAPNCSRSNSYPLITNSNLNSSSNSNSGPNLNSSTSTSSSGAHQAAGSLASFLSASPQVDSAGCGGQRPALGTPLSLVAAEDQASHFAGHSPLATFGDQYLFNALGGFLAPVATTTTTASQQQQFVLSLQQQYLIQAAAAAAAARHQFAESARAQQAASEQRAAQQAATSAAKRAQQQSPRKERQKSELLKFSISTILGSPVAQQQQQQLRRASVSPNKLIAVHSARPDELDWRAEHMSDGEQLEEEPHCSPHASCSPSVMINSPALRAAETACRSQSSPGASAMSQSALVTNYLEHAMARSMATFKQAELCASASASGDKQEAGALRLSADSAVQQQQQQYAAAVNQRRQLGPAGFLTQSDGNNNHNSTSFPWTLTARGKPRRGMMRRAVFSDSQRVGLEKRFQLQKYISKPDRKKLAEKLGLRDSQVKIWFQNRRMKWRNSKERELLSAGGSREQTLPTRNNPNPDLSDVGETIKRLQQVGATSGGPNTSSSSSSSNTH